MTYNNVSNLEAELENAHGYLSNLDPTTTEYQSVLNCIRTLEELINASAVKEEEIRKLRISNSESKKPWWLPSPDAVVGALASFGGIIVVLNHERFWPVASKAFSLVTKVKI